MFDKNQFELIKKKYGHYASWALWADEGKKPKDNIGDVSILDIEKNKDVLKQIKPHIILVGLNISRRIEKPLANFHDPRPYAMDYKIRYALKNTPYYGAYMTDIIKDFEQKISGKVMTYLKENKMFETTNIEMFREEVRDLQVSKPLIIAFGNDSYEILFKNLSSEYDIVKIPHYSHQISKEKYKEEVHRILNISV
ncbi:MAG: hypothetical protein GTO12_06150 [Proteobacteria bacterium]|nr:hypothetical protein [Pseudomonadota bacterium]